MKRLCILLLSLIAAVGAAAIYESMVPADAVAVLHVPDAAAARQKARNHPLVELWKHPDMQAFTEPIRGKGTTWDDLNGEAKRETGYTVDELLDFLQGELVVVLPDIASIMAFVADERQFPEFFIVADLGDRKSEFEKVLLSRRQGLPPTGRTAAGQEYRRTAEKLLGTTLYTEERLADGEVTAEGGWAIVGNTWVIASPIERARQTVAAVSARGTAAGLATSPEWREVKGLMGPYDSLAYVNLNVLLPPFLDLLKARLDAPQAETGPQGQPMAGPSGITYDNVNAALALDNLRSLYTGIRAADDMTTLQGGLQFREPKGIVRLLDPTGKSVRIPGWVPAAALHAGVASLDMSAWWDRANTAVAQLNPMLSAALQMQLAQILQQTGVDFEKQVIANIGDQMGWMSVATDVAAQPDAAGPTQAIERVLVVEVRDAQMTRNALDKLPAMFFGQEGDLWETRDYQGVAIHEFAAKGSASQRFRYALVGRNLVLGWRSPASLEAAIRGLKAAPANGFWNRPDVLSALGTMAPGPVVLSAQDSARSTATTMGLLGHLPFGGMGAGRSGLNDLDPAKAPAAEVIGQFVGVGVTGTYRTPQSLGYSWHLMHAPKR